MNTDDIEPIVSFEFFDLDFIPWENVSSAESDESGEEEDDFEYDSDEVLYEMQSLIPDYAVEIGTLRDEIWNYTSWEINIHFYVIPLKDTEFTWALFGISWDDNWGRWDWECYARVTLIDDSREAARFMIRHLIERWGFDLSASDNKVYKTFLDSI